MKMKIISLVCSRLQLSFLLFVTSLYYFFEIFIVSLTVCCVNALFSAAAVSYIQGFQCFLRHCSVLGLDCSIFRLLRHHSTSSRFPMLHYLFDTSLLCSRLQLSPLLFVASLYIFKFPLFHYSVCYVMLCSRLQQSPLLFVASLISSSFHCFIILFVASLLCSRFRLFYLLFVMSLSYFFQFSIVSLSTTSLYT